MHQHSGETDTPEFLQSSNELSEVNLVSSDSLSSLSCLDEPTVDDISIVSPSSTFDETGIDCDDNVGFLFDHLEVDFFMSGEDDYALIGSYHDLLSMEANSTLDCRLSSPSSSSHQRRRSSSLAVMRHFCYSTNSPTVLDECCLEEPNEEEKRAEEIGIMQKLDDCMRRTAESRAQIMKLVMADEGEKQDEEEETDSTNSHIPVSSIFLPRQGSASLKRKWNVTKKTKHGKHSSSKDGRRSNKMRSQRRGKLRRSSSEYACSGVLFNRVATSVSESEVLHLPSLMGSSCRHSKTSIHHILNEKKRAGLGNARWDSQVIQTSSPPSSIASFLRQRKMTSSRW